ncbi:MAG: ScyD/ScyE family protein [Thermomicrobiales bacterium]|nr:ScyD/ScyE family protein [Thermomicrobiales bacterium]
MYLTDAGSPDAASPDDCLQVGDPADDLTVCFTNSGSVIKVVDGTATTVASGLPGTVADIQIAPDGTIYVLTGLGADPSQVRPIAGDKANGFGAILKVDTDTNTWTEVADVSGYEVDANPDGGAIDTNPYGFTMVDGGFLVADAGANAVLSVTAEGDVSTFAVFPPQMVDAPPFLGLDPGAQIPMEAVPTSVAQGPDGAFYVSELTGFPFNVGSARIWRVADNDGDGDALEDGEMTVAATGFTNLVDLGFDDLGHLYALEIASGGLLAAESSEDPAAFAGAVVRVEADGSHTVLADNGLIAPTGMTINNGGIYVANFGVMPGMGQIVKLRAAASTVAVVATGLQGPRGLTVASDGAVYVAEAGTAGDACATIGEGDDAVTVCAGTSGAITRVANGTQEQVVTGLPSVNFGEDVTGPHDVVVGDMGQLYTIIGLGTSAENRDAVGPALVGDAASEFGTILAINDDGTWDSIADVSAYESSANPDGGAIDSNPFSLVLTESGFVVADSGMNGIVNVHPDGDNTTFETLGVIDDRMVDAPPFLGLPDGVQIPMQGVPTGIVQGPDGAYYVGELTGFPFEVGAARVWRIAGPDDMSVVAEGFTNILDIAFDSHGNMYVLEMAQNGLLAVNPDDPSTMTGALVKVASDGTQTTIMSNGLVMPTGMAIGSDDSIYISNFGVVPGMGQVIKINQ